ncbi:hypothetical protein LNKW23_28500 [Paralimibaculum aggregatum]|uniref:Basal-body rod modification protein FlgD n=1 Tax=Paralimibaculum aggregatum TaxID=3036245 RepID=A0ABQ6LKY9_9RHOB|nr:flagellar hook capping FlgD N-terminal domain-containing protein [Limibaculum sp. NKW23]GMG83637.1 hypothetical protein LNKW23_28500 [Limibaculum sp. NKW23]
MDIVANAPLFPQLAAAPEAQAGEAADTAETAATASADFTSFLNLLTAQLRNQDPLQPLDSTQFVAQLASFSTVEQLIGTNRRLDEITDQGDAQAAAVYAGWIGQQASLTDGSFRADGEAVEFGYPAMPGADSAVAAIRRPDGVAIATIPLDPNTGGMASWSGEDAAGAVATGELTIDIGYFSGESLLDQRAATIYRQIIGVRGTDAGAVIEFADGGAATPAEIAALRAPRDPE